MVNLKTFITVFINTCLCTSGTCNGFRNSLFVFSNWEWFHNIAKIFFIGCLTFGFLMFCSHRNLKCIFKIPSIHLRVELSLVPLSSFKQVYFSVKPALMKDPAQKHRSWDGVAGEEHSVDNFGLLRPVSYFLMLFSALQIFRQHLGHVFKFIQELFNVRGAVSQSAAAVLWKQRNTGSVSTKWTMMIYFISLCGAPQGSILVPILFTMHECPLCLLIRSHNTIVLMIQSECISCW